MKIVVCGLISAFVKNMFSCYDHGEAIHEFDFFAIPQRRVGELYLTLATFIPTSVLQGKQTVLKLTQPYPSKVYRRGTEA